MTRLNCLASIVASLTRALVFFARGLFLMSVASMYCPNTVLVILIGTVMLGHKMERIQKLTEL